MIVRAVRDAIVADASIASRFGRWDFGDGVLRPAVFTCDPAPYAAPAPKGVIQQDPGRALDTRGARGADGRVNVRIWGDKSFSGKGLRDLANDIWRLLHFGVLTVEGYDFHGMTATMPAELVDRDGFPGFTMDVTVKVLQSVQ